MNHPSTTPNSLAAFRQVPRTGVIYVTEEANKAGFRPEDPTWCNLGQGMPETGAIDGAPERLASIPVHECDLEYAPVAGLPELREAVASMYNRTFRRGKASRYTAENVAIGGGGRVGIMRACAAISPVHLGHFLPDYTAYEELLDVFRRFQPFPILLDPDEQYYFSADSLRREILGRGLGAIVMSNPCNPTGRLLQGDLLDAWIHAARELRCALIFDEFYSHFAWSGPRPIVSAAEYVEDVDRDPIVLIDGLTKNWRYPGFRVSWTVGPRSVIEAVSSAGSFLDGGGSRPMQRAAIDLLDEGHVEAETAALHRCFLSKRQRVIEGLRDLGVRLDLEPEGTFYAWADLQDLPPSLRGADDFFRAGLSKKVITVPGHFFDINPGKRRMDRPSRFRHHIRFSFGPTLDVIEEALSRLKEMVSEAG
ncbi:MAG: pyridoxal phosphate-dependent aminotransferase [Myxococcota bacterium]